MIDLPLEKLESCQTDCLKVFEKTRELRGQDKDPVYQMDEFKEVCGQIRRIHPNATDREVLAYILRSFAHALRAA